FLHRRRSLQILDHVGPDALGLDQRESLAGFRTAGIVIDDDGHRAGLGRSDRIPDSIHRSGAAIKSLLPCLRTGLPRDRPKGRTRGPKPAGYASFRTRDRLLPKGARAAYRPDLRRGRLLRLVPAILSSSFLLIDLAIPRDAPRRLFLDLSPRFAARAAP